MMKGHPSILKKSLYIRSRSLIMMADTTDLITRAPWKEKNWFNTWDSSPVRGHCKEELRQESSIKMSVSAVAVDESVSKMMWQLLKQQSTPDIVISLFSGNPMKFYYFMAKFNEIVEKKVDDPRGKLTWLIQRMKKLVQRKL